MDAGNQKHHVIHRGRCSNFAIKIVRFSIKMFCLFLAHYTHLIDNSICERLKDGKANDTFLERGKFPNQSVGYCSTYWALFFVILMVSKELPQAPTLCSARVHKNSGVSEDSDSEASYNGNDTEDNEVSFFFSAPCDISPEGSVVGENCDDSFSHLHPEPPCENFLTRKRILSQI